MRDVLLVGDGPAGSGLAHFLAKQGRAVLLIDQADYPCDKTCGDGPTPRALRVLRTMGVLDEVAAAGQHINGVHIYELGGRRIEAPITPWHDLPAYTLVVPRYRLDDWLRRKAVAAGAK